MLTENTISKLREIRLGTMAEAFREQLTNPEISALSFEDRFGLLVDAEARYKKGSIIFCSQFEVKGWRDKIGSQIVADAICDRIVHDSYRVVIECRESMRKLFGGLKKAKGACGSSGSARTRGLSLLRFSEESGDCAEQKKKSDASGITLLAKPRTRCSGRSSALPYPPLRLKAIL